LRVFVSYKFENTITEKQADFIRQFVESMGLKYVDGKGISVSGELTTQLKKIIDDCDVFISIQNKDLITDYIKTELSYAKGRDKETMVISNTLDSSAGIYSDTPLIVFKEEVQERSPQIAKTLYEWRMADIFGNFQPNPDVVHNTSSSEIFSKMSELKLLDTNRHKKHFNYSVFLEETDCEELEGFFRAKFHIKFVSVISNDVLVIQTKRSSNNFHKEYRNLVRDTGSVYRYILKAPEGFELKSHHFMVTKFEVDEVSLNKSGTKCEGDDIVISFDTEEIASKINTNEEVQFDIEIDTIVQKNQNEFTMIFGYPVMGIDVTFEHQNTDIKEVDVVDIFTSRQFATKNALLAADGRSRGAKASVLGWVLPESAVVFIWKC